SAHGHDDHSSHGYNVGGRANSSRPGRLTGHGGAAGVDRADPVQRARIPDRVAVHGEDVGVEARRDASLAVPETDHPGRRRGPHSHSLVPPGPPAATASAIAATTCACAVTWSPYRCASSTAARSTSGVNWARCW